MNKLRCPNCAEEKFYLVEAMIPPMKKPSIVIVCTGCKHKLSIKPKTKIDEHPLIIRPS